MQLKNDFESQNTLSSMIREYFNEQGRCCTNFSHERVADYERMSLHFLVDRNKVIRYDIINDPNPQGDRWLGGVLLAIGPHYFNATDFWSYDQSERFRMSATTESVLHNLRLLDEFWRT